MDICLSNFSNKPIYEQISNQIKKLILLGDLSEADLLPSIRKLAKSLKICVVNTKRTYYELEKKTLFSLLKENADNKELFKKDILKNIERKLLEVIEESKLYETF